MACLHCNFINFVKASLVHWFVVQYCQGIHPFFPTRQLSYSSRRCLKLSLNLFRILFRQQMPNNITVIVERRMTHGGAFRSLLGLCWKDGIWNAVTGRT
jgi:hypothetical protein